VKTARCRSVYAGGGQRAALHVHRCRKGRDHTGAHQCRVPGCRKAWYPHIPLAVREEFGHRLAEQSVQYTTDLARRLSS